MGTTQTTYSSSLSALSPGSQSSSDFNVVTGITETVAGIPFGRAVGQGSSSDKGAILGGTLDQFRGISLKDATLVVDNSDKYLPSDSIGILDRGQIWVEPGEAVSANDPVWFNSTTGVFYKQTGSGRVGPVLGAKFVTSCGVGGRAEIKLGGISNYHVDAVV